MLLRASRLSLFTITVIGAIAAISQIAAAIELLMRGATVEPVTFVPMGIGVSGK